MFNCCLDDTLSEMGILAKSDLSNDALCGTDTVFDVDSNQALKLGPGGV